MADARLQCTRENYKQRVIHVLPAGDLVPHCETVDCWCQPTPDAEYGHILVHHSADGREAREIES